MLTWNVDARRPHPYTRLYTIGMWVMRDKKAFEGEQDTLRTARKRQRTGDSPPRRLTRMRSRVTSTWIAGMTVWTVRPRRKVPAVRVVYLHGGSEAYRRRSFASWLLQLAAQPTDTQPLADASKLRPGAWHAS